MPEMGKANPLVRINLPIITNIISLTTMTIGFLPITKRRISSIGVVAAVLPNISFFNVSHQNQLLVLY